MARSTKKISKPGALVFTTPTEHQSQCAVIQWRDENWWKFPGLHLLHAIPNGGVRHLNAARKLKKEGVLSGIPDLFLPVPRGIFHGQYIEMKKIDTGKVSKEQAERIADLRAQGYAVNIAMNAQEAIKAIIYYYSLGEFHA